jgi:glutathione S-transferase
MLNKPPLRPDRLRQIPTSFSWVDHRLIRHEYLRGADPTAWALYLFLLTVADAQGLSYYSDASIARHLNLDALTVSADWSC